MRGSDTDSVISFALAIFALCVLVIFRKELFGFVRNLLSPERDGPPPPRRSRTHAPDAVQGLAAAHHVESHASTHDTYASSPATGSDTFSADSHAHGGDSWSDSAGSGSSATGGEYGGGDSGGSDYGGGDSGGGGDYGGGGSGGGWS